MDTSLLFQRRKVKQESRLSFLNLIKNILSLNFSKKNKNKSLVVREFQNLYQEGLSDLDFFRGVSDALLIVETSENLRLYLNDKNKKAFNKQVLELVKRAKDFVNEYTRKIKNSVNDLLKKYQMIRMSLDPSQVKILDSQLEKIKDYKENIEKNSNNLNKFIELAQLNLTEEVYKKITSALGNILEDISSLEVYIPQLLKTIEIENKR